MFDKEILRQIFNDAISRYPQECCGIVVDSDYIPLPNSHEMPEEHFRIAPQFIYKHLKSKSIRAIVHSHTNSRSFPSRHDMQRQIMFGVPWGIVMVGPTGVWDCFWFGDGVPIPPIMGRIFRHGVTDCYALVKDWFQIERGITLPNLARENEWWDNDESILIDNFAAFGFREIPFGELQRGDCLLGKIMSPVPNHCGVYLGANEILHHLPKRPSRIDMIGPWRKFITHTLRYET